MLFRLNFFRATWAQSSAPEACASKVFSNLYQTESRQATFGRHYHGSEEKITLNERELKKFQEFEKLWWDKEKLPALHAGNRTRVPAIKNGILSALLPQCGNTLKPLQGITVLDVGCGGGLLAEAIARLGAHVTGIDPVPECIEVARHHAELDTEIQNNLKYICSTLEDHCKENKKYDAVLCSEVLDHVNNVPYFVKCCIDLVVDNGYLHFSTINRTVFAYLYVILLAENVFRFIPRGSHQWRMFVKPGELKTTLEINNCRILETRGHFYNPITKMFYPIPYTGGFYSFCAVKEPAL